ncbi:TetR/AcrR family transcriptional regulator [Nocardia nova]|uniref:TetR/AcrR family transcriptional regulator n=1 Tax=Nocardia nova TaxID=37330 RepID=UPI0033C3A0CA
MRHSHSPRSITPSIERIGSDRASDDIHPPGSIPGNAKVVHRSRAPKGSGYRTREEILIAAEALLSRTADGRSLTIRGITEHLGLTAPTIYRYFPHKQALLAAVAETYWRDLSLVMNEAAPDTSKPLAALQEQVAVALRFAAARPHWFHIVEADMTERLHSTTHGTYTLLRDRFAGTIERMQLSPASRWSDPERGGQEVLASLCGVLRLAMAAPDYREDGYLSEFEELLRSMIARLAAAGESP